MKRFERVAGQPSRGGRGACCRAVSRPCSSRRSALLRREPRVRVDEPQQRHAADDAAVRRGARDRVARPDARRHAGRHRPLGRRRTVALRRDPDASTRPATTARLCRRSASRSSRRSPFGSLNGFLIGRMRLNPIVATLGTNALLYGAVLWYTAGIPTHDDRPPRRGSGAGSGSASRPRCTSPSPPRPSSRRWSS